jgi:PAS domain S-box-containing protein
MRALIRAHAWNKTSLGPIEAWPHTLKTLAGLMLSSDQPMYIVWGDDRVWLHNDAMIPVMGIKHPGALGQHALNVVWAEARETLAPLFTEVFEGASVQMNDIGLALDRDGKLEQAHFAFSYTPIRDERGEVAGLFGACIETTDRVKAEQRAKDEGQRFQQLFDQAPTFMAVLRGPQHRIEYANPGYHALVGHREVVGRAVAEALPDAAAQGYIELLDNVYRTGEVYNVAVASNTRCNRHQARHSTIAMSTSSTSRTETPRARSMAFSSPASTLPAGNLLRFATKRSPNSPIAYEISKMPMNSLTPRREF